MKKITFMLLTVVLAHAGTLHAAEPDYAAYGALLKKYVKADGVDYAAWHENKADVNALDTHLDRMAEVDVKSLSREAQMAFYINLYNAAMLQAVFDDYPIKTVTTILPDFGIFKKEFIRLGGKRLSLDGVEKGILLKQWDDGRIHFAVNCASISCPPLRNEPFTAAKLDAQLDEQSRAFAASRHAANLDKQNKTVRVSALFNWYADDFTGKNAVEYLNRYRNNKLPSGWKIAYQEYDWGLNASN